jgi:quercetin dioxygenase-like cupin family protein
MRPRAEATLLMENDLVKVWRYDFAPGAETGWHVHGHEYVITTITDCTFHLELPGGGTADTLVMAGCAYSRPKGTEHNVINGGDAPMIFVEVELKQAALGGPPV